MFDVVANVFCMSHHFSYIKIVAELKINLIKRLKLSLHAHSS